MSRSRLPLKLLAALLTFGALGLAAAAQEVAPTGITRALGPSTNLPIPRFVTLKRGEVNMRRGPGADHPIEWVYVRQHLPLQVVNEFEMWRKVRDPEGTEGWISANMLSGERYVMVRTIIGAGGEERWPIRKRPDAEAEAIAVAEPGVIAELKRCPDTWCEIKAGEHTGWIERIALWGVLPDEEIQ